MKKVNLKIFYSLLISGLALLIILLTTFSTENTEEKPPEDNFMNKMPMNSIHKQFKEGHASVGKVSEEFKRKLNDLETLIVKYPNDYASKNELAELYFSSHKTQKAVALYKEIRNNKKLNLQGMYNLSVAYYDLGNTDKAEEITKLIIKNNPSEYKAIFNLGSIKAAQGKKEQAIKIWSDLIKLYPNTEEANLAINYIKQL